MVYICLVQSGVEASPAYQGPWVCTEQPQLWGRAVFSSSRAILVPSPAGSCSRLLTCQPLCVCLPVCVSGEQGSQGHLDTSPQKCCGRTHTGSPWTCGPVVSLSDGLFVLQPSGPIGPSPLSATLLPHLSSPAALPRRHPVYLAGWVPPILG